MLWRDQQERIVPSASASGVAGLFVAEQLRNAPGVWIPRTEIHLVVRFGSRSPSGVDAHAVGVRKRVHRKALHAGQRTVTARLRLGAHEAVLGVPAAQIVERIVALEDLWGSAATRELGERLADSRSTTEAVVILERVIAERLAAAPPGRAPSSLALSAATRLARLNVAAVAEELGVSERHLRRVFTEAVGVSPKAFAKLARFRRALRAASQDRPQSWASIAAASGYYDQAHLIAEFRAIAGATPSAFLGELEPTGLTASRGSAGRARPRVARPSAVPGR